MMLPLCAKHTGTDSVLRRSRTPYLFPVLRLFSFLIGATRTQSRSAANPQQRDWLHVLRDPEHSLPRAMMRMS